jgi:CDP-glucose 4,6-dehydratase
MKNQQFFKLAQPYSGGITAASWRNTKVLVTGSSGFVGSHLCKQLVDEGFQVTGIVRDTDRRSLVYDVEPISLVHCDITDSKTITRILSDYEPDIIFHLAAQAIVTKASRYPAEDFDSNCLGTWTLFQAILNSKILMPSVIVASTDKVYGDAPLPYTEDTVPGAEWPYEVSKLAEEMIARSYARRYLIPIAISRMSNIYGPGDFTLNRLIPETIMHILNDEIPVIRSDGKYWRDYMYIDDAVNAYMLLAKHLFTFPEVYSKEIFNFSSHDNLSVLQVVTQICKEMDSEWDPIIKSDASHEIRRQAVNYLRAEKTLGYETYWTFEMGLEKTIEWYRNYHESLVR